MPHLQEKDEINQPTFPCRKCSNRFPNISQLKLHIKSNHPKHIKCKVCNERFDENHELEYHLENTHGKVKEYKCQLCDSSFVLQWRLMKHKEMHKSKRRQRTCHYYNNGKICPFEKVGCMFSHEEARKCLNFNGCSRTMCQFRHG